MKAFLTAIVAIVATSWGAYYLLQQELPFSTAERTSADSVRLGAEAPGGENGGTTVD